MFSFAVMAGYSVSNRNAAAEGAADKPGRERKVPGKQQHCGGNDDP
jgi:hypothetical protein